MIFTDGTSELHIRLHIAEMLKDKVENDNYAELCEKAYKFITNGVVLPPQEEDAFAKVMSNLTNGLTQAIHVNKQLDDIANSLPKPQTNEKEEKLKELANKNLKRLVTHKGVNCYICGYSVEFDCLIAETFDDISGGVLLGDKDCVLCHDYPFYLYVPKDIVK